MRVIGVYPALEVIVVTLSLIQSGLSQGYPISRQDITP
jgi:hypothetical protein